MDMQDLRRVLKAVDDEPEAPDEMPDDMFAALVDALERGDKETIMVAFRIMVRLTKENIRKRIALGVFSRWSY
jgi:hypothetical protein